MSLPTHHPHEHAEDGGPVKSVPDPREVGPRVPVVIIHLSDLMECQSDPEKDEEFFNWIQLLLVVEVVCVAVEMDGDVGTEDEENELGDSF
jgi:hypothetical protein